MNCIQNFHEVRKDGKVIFEGASSEQIAALGEISTVVEVCWNNGTDQKNVHLKSNFGVFSRVVQGRKFIAALVYQNNLECTLVVVRPDGQIHLTVPNTQNINGRCVSGSFAWFESAHHPAENVFSVVFQVADRTTSQYWLDINALTGKVLTCTWTR